MTIYIAPDRKAEQKIDEQNYHGEVKVLLRINRSSTDLFQNVVCLGCKKEKILQNLLLLGVA